MKAPLIALFLAVGALAAEAQVTVGGGSWGGTGGGGGYGVGWGSWSGYGGGYGTVGYGGWGWGGGRGYCGGWGYGGWGYGGGSMVVVGDGYGLYYSGPVYGWGWGGGGSAVAPGVAAADPTPGWGPWGGSAFGPYRRSWMRPVSSYSPPPPLREKAPEGPVPTGAVDEGRRRFRLGDYRGALDTFRGAVVANGSDGAAEAHFALGLAVTGDHKNADKALRSALGHGFAGKLDVASMAKDERERAKLAVQLGKAPEAALAAAWALAGLGKPERLDALTAKDADAKKLAGK
jgi:hypothetical protein